VNPPVQNPATEPPIFLPPQNKLAAKLEQKKRPDKFAWRWADTFWIVVIAAACALTVPHSSLLRTTIGISVDFIAAASAYIAGLRMHNRTAGTTAAMLVASSYDFAWLCGTHPTSGALSCAVILAIAGYAVNWPIVTYIAAIGATALGFNGIVIGGLIALVSLIQKRQWAVIGAICLVVFDIAWYVVAARVSLPDGIRAWHTWRDARPLIGFGVLSLWFLAPFYAEATLKGARERWLLGLCLLAGVVFIVFTSSTPVVPQLYIALPIVSLVIGVGLGRLMPMIAGDYPKPPQRYFAATAAALITVLGKCMLEPPQSTLIGTPDISVAPLIRSLPDDSKVWSRRAHNFYWTWIERLTK
jgi:hypothetical protein